MFRTATWVPVLLLVIRVAAPADELVYDQFKAPAKSYSEHLADYAKFRGFRSLPGLYAAIHAHTVRPDGADALVALSEVWPRHRELLVLEAYRRHGDRPAIAAKIASLLGVPAAKLPEVRRFGTATRLGALYVGRSIYDNARRDRTSSVDEGDAVDLRRLLVQGRDADGHLVPVDLTYTATDGLVVESTPTGTPRIVGKEASTTSTLVVRDRKSGLSVTLAIPVIGKVFLVKPMRSESQGKTTLSRGEMLHMRVRMYDEAGNSVWRGRLAWAAYGKGEDASLIRLFGRRYSWMHFEVMNEMHVNTLYAAPDEAYTGPVTVVAIEPESGTRGLLDIEMTSTARPAAFPVGALAWEKDLATARATAREAGKPLLVWLHSTWCPMCHRLATTTLTDERVAAKARSFSCVHLDADVDVNTRLLMMNQVADLPSVIFLSPTGTRLFELPYANRFDVPAFLSSMDKALAQAPLSVERERALEAAFRADPASLATSDALTKFYFDGYRFEDAGASELHAYRLAQQAGAADCDRRMSELVFYQLKLRRFDEAATAIKEFTEQYPKSPHKERVAYYAGLQAFHGGEDLDGAAKLWEEQLNEFPTGNWSANGRNMLGRARALQGDRSTLGPLFPRPRDWGGK